MGRCCRVKDQRRKRIGQNLLQSLDHMAVSRPRPRPAPATDACDAILDAPGHRHLLGPGLWRGRSKELPLSLSASSSARKSSDPRSARGSSPLRYRRVLGPQRDPCPSTPTSDRRASATPPTSQAGTATRNAPTTSSLHPYPVGQASGQRPLDRGYPATPSPPGQRRTGVTTPLPTRRTARGMTISSVGHSPPTTARAGCATAAYSAPGPPERRKTSVSFLAPSAWANPCAASIASIRATPSAP